MSARGAYRPAGAGIAVGTLVVATLLVALAVGIASLRQTPTYEASAQMRVEQQPIQLPVIGGQRQTLAQTAAMAVDTCSVADEVIGRLGLRMGPAELLDNLTAEQVEGTKFIRLTYTDTDPHRAKQVVNTVGEVASERIPETGAAAHNIKAAALYDAAIAPDTPASPDPWRNGLLAAGLGLFLCGGLALRPTHPTS